MHLTPFESYMFVDDTAKYPMTFVIEFEMSGKIDKGAFQTAIDAALQRHPLLRSVIQPAKANRDCWVTPESYDSQVIWLGLDEEIQVDGASEFLDLREEIGFRCWCRHNDEQATLTFVFHHSSVDGMGAYQFLGDLLWLYADQTGSVDGELPELPQSALRERLKAMLGPDRSFFSANDELEDESFVEPLAAPAGDSVGAASHIFPDFKTHTFEKDEYRRIRKACQDVGQTVNDRLLQTCFTVAHQWNSEFDSMTDDTLFGVNMPLDLRQQDSLPFSGTNLVTNWVLRRTGAQIDDLSGLANSLRTEIAQLKYNRHRSPFMRRLVRASLNWKEARDQLGAEQCHSTVVFSNAGDPTKRFLVPLPREGNKLRVGNLLLEDINGVPPLRSQTRATFSIFTYRRRLRICLRCDPFYFEPAHAQDFLNRFVAVFQNFDN